MGGNSARGVKEIGEYLLRPAPEVAGGATLTPDERTLIETGKTTYESLCFSCHANDGRGVPLAGGAPGAMMAPSLAGSPRVNGHRDYVIHVLLKGMTGPLGEGSGSAADIMLPMGTNTDQWIAGVSSYIRSSFGNPGGLVTPADVARVRAATRTRTAPWTLSELAPRLPVRLQSLAAWTLTASHESAIAAQALTTRGWNSGTSQAPGMWLQIELPAATMVTEVEFDSPAPAGRRGAPPPSAANIPFPRGYRVEISLDGVKWGNAVATGKGMGVTTIVTFAPANARFVRVTQTDTTADAPNFAVANLKVFGPGPGK
jgi:mono/diheme cytochrome c family protein